MWLNCLNSVWGCCILKTLIVFGKIKKCIHFDFEKNLFTFLYHFFNSCLTELALKTCCKWSLYCFSPMRPHLSANSWPLPPACSVATLKGPSPGSRPSTGMRITTTKPFWASTAHGERGSTATITRPVSTVLYIDFRLMKMKRGEENVLVFLITPYFLQLRSVMTSWRIWSPIRSQGLCGVQSSLSWWAKFCMLLIPLLSDRSLKT